MNIRYYLLNSILLVFFSLLLPITANAHKVRVFAWPEGGKIYGETAFSGDRKPKNVEITVLDADSDAVLLTTRTDEQGKFSFTIPEQAVQDRMDLVVVINAGQGHRGEWPLPADEYLSLYTSSDLNAEESAPVELQSPRPVDQSQAGLIDEQLLRTIVEEELENKLAPLRQKLAEINEDKPDLRDIIGGIGYILGMAGIIAWIKSKKQQNKDNIS